MRRSFVLPPFRPASCAVLLACAVGFAAAATTQPQGTPAIGRLRFCTSGDGRRRTDAAVSAARHRVVSRGARHAPSRGRPAGKARGGAEEDVSGSADGRSRRRCRGVSRCGPSSVEVRRTALRAERQHAAGERAADAWRQAPSAPSNSAAGHTPWMAISGVRGFYSAIDGSAQPYILTMPENYEAASQREYRLDVFMHGRDDSVLEQQFMTKSPTGYSSKPLGPGNDRFMLQPYGRYSNASRFAGETDGLEAIESVARAYPINRNRIVMTGFSMGGASAWSYIVHYADRWAAASPGAGFTETEVFLRNALATQPQNAVQQTLWHMYDATDYAVNTFNVPVVAYSGGNDAQKQAADAMAAAMLKEGLTLEHIVGPNTGHAYEPHARQQVQDRLDQLVATGRKAVPKEIRFTTWMLRYNKMFWLTVDAMAEEWQRARVDARIDGEHCDGDDGKRDGAAPGLRSGDESFRRRDATAGED